MSFTEASTVEKLIRDLLCGGLTYHTAVGAGLESVRLLSGSDSIVAFLNSGINRAERRQEPERPLLQERPGVQRFRHLSAAKYLRLPGR
mgnify:CR=1 FL=1